MKFSILTLGRLGVGLILLALFLRPRVVFIFLGVILLLIAYVLYRQEHRLMELERKSGPTRPD